MSSTIHQKSYSETAPAAAAGGIMAELLPPLCHFPTHELGLIPQSYVLLLRVLRKKKIR